MCGLLGLAGGLLAQCKKNLSQCEARVGRLAGGKIANSRLSTAGLFCDPRLSPAMTGLDFGDNGFPLHGARITQVRYLCNGFLLSVSHRVSP